jgi:hypothetical protein
LIFSLAGGDFSAGDDAYAPKDLVLSNFHVAGGVAEVGTTMIFDLSAGLKFTAPAETAGETLNLSDCLGASVSSDDVLRGDLSVARPPRLSEAGVKPGELGTDRDASAIGEGMVIE